MTIIIITSILILFTIAGVLIGLASYSKYNDDSRVIKKGWPLVFSFILWLLIPLFANIKIISANEVGVVYHQLKGGIQDETYDEGLHMKSVFEKVTIISTVNREVSLETTGQTSDGQFVLFEISLIYRIDAADAGKFFKKTGATDMNKDAMNTLAKKTLQKETIKYTIFQLLSDELENSRVGFEKELKTELYNTYALTLVTVSFDDVDGGTEVEQILKDLAKAEQEIEIARKAAEAKLIQAQADADAQVILADATAHAISVKGKADGEAASAYINEVTKLIDKLLIEVPALTYKEATDIILGIIFYDVWDGKLPEVLTSDSLSALIGSLI